MFSPDSGLISYDSSAVGPDRTISLGSGLPADSAVSEYSVRSVRSAHSARSGLSVHSVGCSRRRMIG